MTQHRGAVFILILVALLAFFPAFFGKVPLNARNLVAFFSPWYYEKFEGFPAGVPSKPGMLDQLRIYYPYMKLTQESYRRGELPLWNPYNFAGNPHMAEWQSGVFYPLHVLLLFLPLPVYWTLYQVTGFLFAGVFTYLFLTNLRLRKIPSLIGAASFMLSSFMSTWNMEVITAPHSILWLPLILLAIDKVTQKDRRMRRWWLVGLAGLVLSILSGYWQTTFYVMAVSVTYALYRATGNLSELKIKRIHLSILAWIPLALLLTSFHLLPTWELYQRSSRPSINLTDELKNIHLSYLLPARHLVTLLIPDYYGHPTTRNYFANVGGGWYYEHVLFIGTIPAIFALTSLVAAIRFRTLRTKRDIWFWWLIALVAGSFSFKLPWAEWVYQAQVPVLSTGIANRVLFVSAFSLSVLAAFGFDMLYRKRFQKLVFTTTTAGLLIIAGIVAVTWFSRSSFSAEKLGNTEFPLGYITSIRNSILPMLLLSAAVTSLFLYDRKANTLPVSKLKRTVSLCSGVILILAIAQNLYQHHKFTAFSENKFVYPEHPVISWLQSNASVNRYAGYNGQLTNSNFATYFGIYAVDGYDSLNDYRRTMLIYSSETSSLKKDIPRAADANLDTNLSSPQLLKLMRLLGVRYLVERPDWLDFGSTAGKPRLPQASEKQVFQDGEWKIWEYLDAYDRSFLAGEYEVFEDDNQLIKRLYEQSFNPREKILLSARPPAGFNYQSDPASTSSIQEYRPTKIVINTRSATDQLLFLSDTWYPGWRAKLDTGQELPVLQAFYALRAIPVPAGDHQVTLWYFPDSFRRGLLIALTSGMGVLVILVVESRKHA